MGHKKMNELTEDELKLVKAFRADLEKYAEENGLEITDVKGWTETTIIWMALNERKCHCRPKDRSCPCPEGLKECHTASDHECLCSVFKLKR